jgi:hypothetical protein
MYQYTEEQLISMKKVEATRASRIEKLHARMSAEEKDAVLAEFHPDYITTAYEELKVDGIILEFYDLWGYAGTLEITDKKSYSGVFTKIISLNTINALSNKKIVEGRYNN